MTVRGGYDSEAERLFYAAYEALVKLSDFCYERSGKRPEIAWVNGTLKVDERGSVTAVDGRLRHVYLAGLMSGVSGFNFDAFAHVRGVLRLQGFEVTCPAELAEKKWPAYAFSTTSGQKPPEGFDYVETMVENLRLLAACDAIVLLPGWAKSHGANMEFNLAQALKLPAVEIFAGLKFGTTFWRVRRVPLLGMNMAGLLLSELTPFSLSSLVVGKAKVD